MKLLIILTISFLIFYYIIKNNCICYNWIKEHFEPLYYNQNDQDYQKIKNSQSTQVNCCLVEKKYIPISNELFGGNFTYLFTKYVSFISCALSSKLFSIANLYKAK